MVTITVEEGTLHLQVVGLGEMLATVHAKESVAIEDVVGIALGADDVQAFHVFAKNSNAKPILGGFHDEDHDLNFYDVHPDRVAHVVSIGLKNHKYAKFIVDVEDPQATIALVQGAIGGSAV